MNIAAQPNPGSTPPASPSCSLSPGNAGVSVDILVRKRDGRTLAFQQARIHRALLSAGRATGAFDTEEAQRLAAQVTNVVEFRHREGAAVDIEEIQNIVEQVLVGSDHLDTARAYIAYRERHRQLRENHRTLVDVGASIDEYLRREDWRVAANANQGFSLGGLILNSAGKMIANYWLNHVYTAEIGAAHRDGDLHLHDLDMLSGYCAGWSLRTLLQEGLNGVPGKVESAPPAHLSSAVAQIVNFLGTLQNEWAGAQAFSSFDTYLAPYIRKDQLGYREVRQCMQELIFNLNVPSRWGTQTPFTNLTFDWVCPRDLQEQVPVIAGREMPFCYGDLQGEMDLINRAYIEVMSEGDARGRVFTFPIPTYNITEDFPWHSENAERLFAMTARYGLPYFQNFINSDLSPHMVRSMCCRLQLDLRELLKRGNGLFGSAEQTGSLGVVTINCARLGYLYRGDEQTLMARLDQLLELARSSLEVKRKVIQRHMDTGLFPYTRRYLGTLRNHFSTIGVNGINEMLRNFSGDRDSIVTPSGQRMAERLLDHIRARMTDFQQQTGHLYNLEATPAEGTTYRFAREDRKRYADILQAGTAEAPYYTNSSQLPAGFTADPFEALARQEPLQRRYTGGTVLHLYLGERLPDADSCRRLVRRALTNYQLPYITVTPSFSICPAHGYLSGEHQFCPRCDEVLIARQLHETHTKPRGTSTANHRGEKSCPTQSS
ncbi:ribonucleoside triphosphate reductase [Microbulbifer sp. TYP-18]|uniref:ribonucleoside triphosphate reductase n=1 Tax=Microbulbifer sp. TYP-18 TaxID=3230024 RepID=UPI0034C5C49F